MTSSTQTIPKRLPKLKATSEPKDVLRCGTMSILKAYELKRVQGRIVISELKTVSKVKVALIFKNNPRT